MRAVKVRLRVGKLRENFSARRAAAVPRFGFALTLPSLYREAKIRSPEAAGLNLTFTPPIYIGKVRLKRPRRLPGPGRASGPSWPATPEKLAGAAPV